MELILRSANIMSGQDDYIVIDFSPFRVGRGTSGDYQVRHPEVSGQHAEFRFEGGRWWVVDLGSTNGTFVNGVRISGPVRLKPNDMVHFGTKGYRVVASIRPKESLANTLLSPDTTREARAAVELFQVIQGDLSYSCFQPTVELATRRTVGWEALGRAATEDPTATGPLFSLAEKADLATTLSRTFRAASSKCLNCRTCWRIRDRAYIFLNLHPQEILTPRFAGYLEEIAWGQITDHFQLVLEIPEALACNAREMAVWVEEIRSHEMLVAYDDFGKGQSRISDLLHVPPDFLKLDRELVAELGGNRIKTDLVHAVVDACHDLRVRIIAEGIETENELRACAAMGIHYGQGYHLTPPRPAWEIFGIDPGELPDSCPFVTLGLLPRVEGRGRQADLLPVGEA